MDVLLLAAIVVVCLIAVGIFFVFKYVTSKSGGNDDVWKPGDTKGPNPEA